MRNPRLLAVTCALLLFSACAGLPPEERADWQRLQDEGRIATKERVDAASERSAAYRWSDGIVELEAAYAPHPLGRGLRLTTHLQSPRGSSRTQFVLDTGSTSSWLSWGSPLSHDVHASPERTMQNAYGRRSRGHWGYLPEVQMGSLRGTDLPVVLREVEHSLGSSGNLLGFPHVFHTQIEHVSGRWRLRSGQARTPALPPGWRRVAFNPGYPVVRILDPDGRPTVALLDTGAPENHALRGAPRGQYTLPFADGKTTLPLPVRKTAPYPVMSPWGEEITVLIGMQWLAAHDWRMTFDKATWAFAPRAVARP